MHTSKLLGSVGVIIFIFALISACSSPPKPAGPKFTGRVLFLNGDTANGANLSELSVYGEGYNMAPFVTDTVFDAAASPDQSRLVYATDDAIKLRDFRGGESKSIIKEKGFCLAWAPDGNHISYKQRPTGKETGWKLFVSDLEGKTKPIWEDTTESSDCGLWIAPDRLVFDRFVGTLQKPKAGEAIKPNTTTVVTVGEALKFRDTQKKWSIESVCAKGNVALVRAVDQSQVLIAKNVDHFETIDPSPGPCSECRFVGYAAQSCVPFFIEQPTSTTTELFSLNPTNWQKQRSAAITWTFSPSAKMLIKSSARLMVVGDVPDKLLLIDTQTGDVTPFFSKQALPVIKSPVPVVWIEN
jgi:hypothetical protein